MFLAPLLRTPDMLHRASGLDRPKNACSGLSPDVAVCRVVWLSTWLSFFSVQGGFPCFSIKTHVLSFMAVVLCSPLRIPRREHIGFHGKRKTAHQTCDMFLSPSAGATALLHCSCVL